MGGHITGDPEHEVYASNVKTGNVRILFMIARHNGMKILMGDATNAYPHAKMKEKVYVIARPEFRNNEGRYVVIDRALYGLKTSGHMWHAHFSEKLRSLGWIPSKADADLWMRENGDDYEYLATHTDDFIIISTNPKRAMSKIEQIYIIKDLQELKLYLGGD